MHWRLKNITEKLMYGLKFLYDHLRRVFADDKAHSMFFFDKVGYFCINPIF